MRSIETLVREFPQLTGAEIIALQEQDKLEDQKKWEEIHAETVAWVNDINQNGGFFRGIFGLSQRFFYKVEDVELEPSGRMYGTVTKLVFIVDQIELRREEYQKLENYGFNYYTRVTEEEYENAVQAFYALKNLWPEAAEQEASAEAYRKNRY